MKLTTNYSTNQTSQGKISFDGWRANCDTLVIDLKKLTQEERECLYERLALRFQDKRKSSRVKHKSQVDRNDFNLQKSGYRRHYFLKDTDFLSVFLGPVYPRLPEVRITFHQSQIGSFTKTLKLLLQVFDVEITNQILRTGFFSRLDICLDIPISLMKLLSMVDRLGVRRIGKEVSQKETIYYGSKKPFQVAIYEKELEECDGHVLTRIECRMYGAKIPIRGLINLSELGHANIFNTFRLYEIDEAKWNRRVAGNERLQKFDDLRKSIGLTSAKTKVNNNNNYNRDIGKLFVDCVKTVNLNQIFHERFRHNNPDIFLDFIRGSYIDQSVNCSRVDVIPKNILIDDELVDDELIDDEQQVSKSEIEVIGTGIN